MNAEQTCMVISMIIIVFITEHDKNMGHIIHLYTAEHSRHCILLARKNISGCHDLQILFMMPCATDT